MVRVVHVLRHEAHPVHQVLGGLLLTGVWAPILGGDSIGSQRWSGGPTSHHAPLVLD